MKINEENEKKLCLAALGEDDEKVEKAKMATVDMNSESLQTILFVSSRLDRYWRWIV